MDMMDIINPRGALRRVTKELATSIGEASELYWDNLGLKGKLACAERRAEKYAERVYDLEARIKEAHFRNPKTGRIGRKGETFNV